MTDLRAASAAYTNESLVHVPNYRRHNALSAVHHSTLQVHNVCTIITIVTTPADLLKASRARAGQQEAAITYQRAVGMIIATSIEA